jgi:uncharacterized membrane protein
MAGFRAFILIMQVSSGLLMIGLAVPLTLRLVGPNAWYGFRVRKTMDDPAIWYEANAYAGKSLLASGIVIVVTSLDLYFAPNIDGPIYAIACTLITLGAIGMSVILSFRFLGRIKKTRTYD